jgi:hypothetical protein
LSFNGQVKRKIENRRIYGQSKTNGGSSEKYKQGRSSGQAQKNLEAVAEKNAACTRATGSKS